MTAIHKQADPELSNKSGIYLPRRGLIILLTLLAAGGLAVAAIILSSDTAAEKGTKALVKAYSKRRLIEPRLSGGFRAGTYSPDAPDLADVDMEQVEEARNYILETADQPNDIDGRLTHGRYLLATGKSSKAIRVLRPITLSNPSSPEARNDLGVCLLERQRVEEALEEFNLALKHAPDMPEALFNRALCYAKLQLTDAARDDLTRLRGLEKDQGWQQEISHRLEKTEISLDPRKPAKDVITELKAAVSSGDIAKARDLAAVNFEAVRGHAYLTDVIVYLKASINNDKALAEQTLSELELIGRLFVETKGDSEIADLALYMRGLPDSSKAEELKLNEEFAQANNLFELQKYMEAEAAHARLENVYRTRGNPIYQSLCGYYIGMSQYSNNSFATSIATLESVLDLIEGRNWPYHRARVIGQLGISYSRAGKDSQGIKYCRQAKDIFSSLKNVETLDANMQLYLSVAYSHLGDLDKALENIRGSAALQFTKMPNSKESLPRYFTLLSSNFLEMADIYRRRENHVLSLLFARQAFGYAEQSKNNRYAAQASSLAALEQAQIGRFDEANDNIEVALKYMREIPDQKRRSFTEQLVYTRAGEVARRQANVEKALDYYAKAEAVASMAEEKHIPMINVLRGRAAVLMDANRRDEARASLSRAVDYIEGYRLSIEKGEQRSYFLDATHAVFDQLISLHKGTPDLEGMAFDFSEQSRARSLLDESSKGESGSCLQLDAIQAALPADMPLVQYSVTKDGTTIFVATRDDFSTASSTLTIKESDDLVRDYRALLKSVNDRDDFEELSEKARTLYKHLIEPVKDKLSGAANICIVPDKSLHFLPFAALIDSGGQYLIESVSISYSPSASVLVRCLREELKKTAQPSERMLAVGNPQIDTKEFSDLADLKEAAQEAIQSARFYDKSSTVLIGPQATKERILADIKNADVTHLALHTLVKEGAPSQASLVLAGHSNRLLTLEEVYNLSLPRTRLVVLSACQSGLGHYYRGEGMVSLVRPFIVSGVPTVVASLWQVESHTSCELMIDFHKARKLSNFGAARALRDAQVKMMNANPSTHPYFWAPFIVVGSYN